MRTTGGTGGRDLQTHSMAYRSPSLRARGLRRVGPLVALVAALASISALWAWTRSVSVSPPGVAVDTGVMPSAARTVSTQLSAAPERQVASGTRLQMLDARPERTRVLRGVVRVNGVGRAAVDVVLAEIDADALPKRAGRSWRVVSDASGRFSVEDGPDSGSLRIEACARGFARARRDVAISADEPADEIVLDLESLPEPFARVHGTVVNADGTPAARARVALGTTRTATDREGRFALDLAAADPTADLVAVVAGSEPVVCLDFGARLGPGADLAVQLVLEGPSASISGMVSDSAGAPLKNWKVAIDGNDPAGIALGREPTRTNAQGEFSIDDLAQGRYALRAWNRQRDESVSLPGVDAGASGVVLRVP